MLISTESYGRKNNGNMAWSRHHTIKQCRDGVTTSQIVVSWRAHATNKMASSLQVVSFVQVLSGTFTLIQSDNFSLNIGINRKYCTFENIILATVSTILAETCKSKRRNRNIPISP